MNQIGSCLEYDPNSTPVLAQVPLPNEPVSTGFKFKNPKPTVILTTNPHYVTMEEELFGPVLTIYVYKDDEWKESLELVDKTSPYGLTGAIFAQDRSYYQLCYQSIGKCRR